MRLVGLPRAGSDGMVWVNTDQVTFLAEDSNHLVEPPTWTVVHFHGNTWISTSLPLTEAAERLIEGVTPA